MTLSLPVYTDVVTLSPTRVAGGLRCLRKHTLDDTLGMKPNDYSAPALDFGTAMHSTAAAYWQALSIGSQSSAILAALTVLRAAASWPINEKHSLDLAERMFAAYVASAKLMPFATQADEWMVLEIEQRRSIQVGGETLTFQLDRLVKNIETKQLALCDLKTASRCDRRWEMQWSRSLQMTLYADCIATHYGRAPDWVIVEGLAKDKPAVHYVVVPEASEARRQEARRQAEWIAKHDRALLDACRNEDGTVDADKLITRSLTETPYSEAECFVYGASCPYLTLCEAEPGERRALLDEGFHYESPKHLV